MQDGAVKDEESEESIKHSDVLVEDPEIEKHAKELEVLKEQEKFFVKVLK